MEPRFFQWNGIKTPHHGWHQTTKVVLSGVYSTDASWLFRNSPGPWGCKAGCATMPAIQAPSEQVSIVHLCTTLYDPVDCIAHQTPLSMEFSKQKYWSELPLSSPRDTPSPGMELQSPAFQRDSLLPEPPVYMIQWPFCISLNCPSPFFLKIFTTTVSYCIFILWRPRFSL